MFFIVARELSSSIMGNPNESSPFLFPPLFPLPPPLFPPPPLPLPLPPPSPVSLSSAMVVSGSSTKGECGRISPSSSGDSISSITICPLVEEKKESLSDSIGGMGESTTASWTPGILELGV